MNVQQFNKSFKKVCFTICVVGFFLSEQMQYPIVDLIWQMNVLLHLKFWAKLFSFYLSSIFSAETGDVAIRQGGSEDESSRVSILSNSKESMFSSIDFNWVSSLS